MADRSDLYLLKRNLYYLLRNEVLFDEYNLDDYSFHENVIGDTAIRDENNGQKYKLTYENLIYHVASFPVTVYRNGFLVEATNYSVNYKDGYILFNDGYVINPIELITVDYTRMLIKVVLAFNYENVDKEELPIIAIDLENTVKTPVELGTTMTYKDRTVYFIVYARNEIELDNIVSLLEAKFDSGRETMVNYKLQEPLDEYGFINPLFSGQASDDYELSINHIETTTLYPASPNEIDKYSAMVETVVSTFI